MAPRREILDSEDEGDGFDSLNDENHDDQNAQFTLNGEIGDHDNDGNEGDKIPPSDKTTSHSTGSTDPVFFQRIYDEQQAAALAQNTADSPAPGARPASSGNLTSPGRPKPVQPASNEKSSLTSVTDPVSGTRKTKKPRLSSKEVANLTQLTTPRKGNAAAEVDPWEMPDSPAQPTRAMGSASTSSRLITRSSEKRRRSDQQSSLDLEPEAGGIDPYEFPSTADASPVRPPKRKKRNLKSSSAQESGSSEAIQYTADLGSGNHPTQATSDNTNAPESSLPPTLPAMYIAPRVLTESQKQQYQKVTVSSQHEQQENGVFQNDNVYKSSGATTIAYPTPSRFRSSVQRGITDDMLPYAVPARDPDGPMLQEPMSSPDELAGSARSTRTRSQAMHGAQPSSHLESPVATRSARRRTRHTSPGEHFDEPIVLDNTQPADEILQDEIRQGFDTNAQVDHSTNDGTNLNDEWGVEQQQQPEDDIVETTAAVSPEPPPKKKRGRKKKESVLEEPVSDLGFGDATLPTEEIPSTMADAPPIEAEEPPTKKRRGRPRKAAATQPETPIEDAKDETTLESKAPPDNEKGGRKGKKKNTKKNKADDDEDDSELNPQAEEIEPARSLADIPDNPRQAEPVKQSKTKKTPDADFEVESKENDDSKQRRQEKQKGQGSEDIEKPAPGKAPATANKAAPITPGKVQYRVGLSRKTRIAPLLKSLKK
ncbi:hypothetical protein V8F33_000484 [Rhypophila sp. PSN 637]